MDATPDLPPRRRVRGDALLRALAHPLRLELLTHLMAVGSRTATECADAVDSTASNCSWHLRQLAQYGLVERTEGGNNRERPWRAIEVGLELGPLDPDSAEHPAYVGVIGAGLAVEQLLTQRFLDTADRQPKDWREAAAVNGYGLRVTPAELTRLTEQIDELLRPYVGMVRTDAPDDARPVHVGVRAFLRLDADGRPSA